MKTKTTIILATILSLFVLYSCSEEDFKDRQEYGVCVKCIEFDEGYSNADHSPGYIVPDTLEYCLKFDRFFGYYVIGNDSLALSTLLQGNYKKVWFICNQDEPKTKIILEYLYEIGTKVVKVRGKGQEFHYAIGGARDFPYRNDGIEICGFYLYDIIPTDEEPVDIYGIKEQNLLQ